MEAGKEVIKVKLSSIIPNRFQPRITFNEEELSELANSIKMYGILQPLILRPIGDKYEIIAGERRYKAATIAGLTEVPAILVNLDDQTSAELAIIENIQRKDLTAIEEAKSYKKLLDLGNLTQDQLAAKMGKKQSTIANKLRLLNLVPEAQEALLNNSISERHARSLLQMKDNVAKQREVLNKIMEGRLTVKETDDLIKSLMNVEPLGGVQSIELNNNQFNDNIFNPILTQTVPVSDINVNSNIETPSVEIPSIGQNMESLQSISEPIMTNDTININEISNPNLDIPTPMSSVSESPTESVPNFEIPIGLATESITTPLNNFNTFNVNSNVYNPVETPMENTFDKTQVIDINAIKEAAKEDPSMPEIPNYDGLLKVEETPKLEEIPQDIQVPKIGEPVTFGNKYFSSLEEEIADVNFGTPFQMQPIESAETILSSQPDLVNANINNFDFGQLNMTSGINNQETQPSKTNLEEAIDMVKEAVRNIQNKGIKIESQETDFSNEHQIIIRISKDPTA